MGIAFWTVTAVSLHTLSYNQTRQFASSHFDQGFSHHLVPSFSFILKQESLQLKLTTTQIHDTRPPSARPNLTDENQVEKYVLPTETYETLSNSVLAWKKANHLGRFDPNAKSADEIAAERAERDATLVKEKGIAVGARVVLLPGDTRRGTIRYVGAIPEIPVTSGAGEGATWVGVQLDEPTGKNDGSVKGKRYFEAGSNCGVFVRPEKVDVGDWEVLDDLDLEDEDMEEI